MCESYVYIRYVVRGKCRCVAVDVFACIIHGYGSFHNVLRDARRTSLNKFWQSFRSTRRQSVRPNKLPMPPIRHRYVSDEQLKVNT